MADEAKVELERELGGELAVLELLTDSECAELLTMFKQARSDEKDALNNAIDSSLSALPWPIRVPAKKIMFPKGKK